jgi:processive 1,2-diacylglycerol beta-glucosyltransferase/1,2-diacylglycerol 3-beta-galactosyltransferase
MEQKKEKYLFLYLNTGGGHLAPARAIADYFTKFHSAEIETVLLNPLSDKNKVIRLFLEDGYRVLQNKAKWLYETIYGIYKFKPVSASSALYFASRIESHLEEQIRALQPDKIVIFHFFCIEPVYRVIEKLGLQIPMITLVTDPYTAHPLWFLRKEQNFIVFSKELAERCISRKIDAKRLTVLPFVINEKFSQVPTPEQIQEYRNRFDLHEERIILIVGGKDGIPHGHRIVRHLLSLPSSCAIVIVCGKNQELFDGVAALKKSTGDTRLKVFGYVDFVYELISTADIVITKCGASTFMEILMLGKIPIVSSYLWEQEKGNVDFLVDNKLGIYENNVEALPAIIKSFLEDSNLLDQYRRNILALEPENGTAAVAKYIKSFSL